MTNTPDTPAQLSDLIRSVEARITTLQRERQALVTQRQDIRRTAVGWLLALVGRAEAYFPSGATTARPAADEGCHRDRGEKAVGRTAG